MQTYTCNIYGGKIYNINHPLSKIVMNDDHNIKLILIPQRKCDDEAKLFSAVIIINLALKFDCEFL
jgi:hypothetical protein